MEARSPRDDWRKQAAGHVPGRRGAQKPGSGRKAKLIVAIVPLLLALGAGIGFLFWLRGEPAPLFLSLPVTETEGWPVNSWALQDGEGLKELFPETGKVAANSQDEEGFLRELNQLVEETEKSKKRGAMIHLCAFAITTPDGVLIVPGKAGPTERSKFIKLSAILQKVGSLHGPRLLVLDLRPVCDPRLGHKGHDLAPAVRAELKNAESSGRLEFLVALQCAPAEYPYVSQELRRGVFAEFLRRGLMGHADGWGPGGNGDGQITATELVSYARERVARWQKLHGVAPATPTFHGTGKDFTLKAVGRERQAPEPVPGPPDYSPAVADGWKQIAAWEKKEPVALAEPASKFAPRTFRDLQETVRRAEDRLLGGANADDLAKDLADRVSRLNSQRDAYKPKSLLPLSTVGRAYRIGLPNEKSIEATLRPIIDTLKKPKAMPDELKAKLGPLVEKPPEPSPYDTIVWLMLKAIIDDKDLAPEQFAGYLSTIQALKPVPTQLELGYLALLCAPGLEFEGDVLRPFPRAVLAAISAAETGPPLTGRGIRRSKEELTKADASLRDAMLAWMSGLPTKDAADEKLAALRKLPDVYKDSFELGKAQASGNDEWMENVALLPSVWPLSPDDENARENLKKLFRACVANTQLLRDALDDAAGANLARRTEDAGFARLQLRAELLKATTNLSVVERRARLRVPIWSPEDRDNRRAEADALALKLAQDGCAEGNDSPDTKAADPRRDTETTRFWEDEASRRADLYAALMGLATRPGSAEAVRKAYDAAVGPAQKEKIAWAIYPAELSAIPASAGGTRHDPTAEARIEADREAASWLANRYADLATQLRALADRPVAQRRADPTKLRDLAGSLEDAARKLRDWSP